jgi:hypothetical protein
MASAAFTNDDAPTAGDIIIIPIDEIRIGQRLRPIDDVFAEALGLAMLRDGQHTAIEVCRTPGQSGWDLVAGGHRVRGAQLAEMGTLEAREVSSSMTYRRMREVSENLMRRDLDPVDRAAFVAEAVRLIKLRSGIDPEKDGRAVSASARWQKEVKAEASDATVTLTVAYGWTDQVAADLGLSKSAVERDLTLYRRLLPSLVEQLRRKRHPVLSNGSQLRALAKLSGDEQAAVVDLLTGANLPLAVKLGGMKAPTKVTEALAWLRQDAKSAPDPEAKRLATFLGTFARMSLAEKKGALAHLAEQLPAGFKFTTGEDA